MSRRQETTAMRAFRRGVILGALTLIGMAATIIVQGGWQAAAAALAIFAGSGFALVIVRICAASERPRSRHPNRTRAAAPAGYEAAATAAREARDGAQAERLSTRYTGSTPSPHLPVTL
jgi:hypothetical protein